MRTSSRIWLRARQSLCALAFVLTFQFYLEAAPIKVGDAFLDLSTYQLEGTVPRMQDGKVVFIDFWASWCEPCKESFPVMDELQQRFGKVGLVILAVNVDEKQEDMERFLKMHPASFAVVRDGQQRLVSSVKVASMPTSFILDSQGKVRHIHRGFHGAETRKQYFKEIEDLLKNDCAPLKP